MGEEKVAHFTILPGWDYKIERGATAWPPLEQRYHPSSCEAEILCIRVDGEEVLRADGLLASHFDLSDWRSFDSVDHTNLDFGIQRSGQVVEVLVKFLESGVFRMYFLGRAMRCS